MTKKKELKNKSIDRYSNPKALSAYIETVSKPDVSSKIIVVPSAPLSEIPVNLVPISDIPKGAKFIYNGVLMQKVGLLSGGKIGCRRLVKHQFSDTLIPAGSANLDPATMIKKA